MTNLTKPHTAKGIRKKTYALYLDTDEVKLINEGLRMLGMFYNEDRPVKALEIAELRSDLLEYEK